MMRKFLTTSAVVTMITLCGCGQQVPPPAATADAAMMQVVDSLNNENPAAVWNMLPASYQQQLTDVKNEFADKMDADLWNSGAELAGKLQGILAEKKSLLLANEKLEKVPMSAELQANYDRLVQMLGVVTSSELVTLDGVRNLDIGTFLSGTAGELMKIGSKFQIEEGSPKPMGMNSILKMPGKILKMKAELVSEDGDSAVVKLTMDGKDPVEQSFVKVEGKWIPEALVKDFPERVSEIKKGIAALEISPEVKATARMAITMVGGVLDQLAAAESQEDLEAVLGGLMGMVMGM